jgi:hypothetical protein
LIAAAMKAELPPPQPTPEPLHARDRSSSEASTSIRTARAEFSNPAVPKANGPASRAGPRKRLQHWELLRAIEKKDLALLFEARDAAFDLLVSNQGGNPPLLYAIRIGKSRALTCVPGRTPA